MSRRILVAGVGNVLMGDDAIGPYCVQQLLARYQFPPDVDVVDLGTPGLDLALRLSSADYVLVVDALRSLPPGSFAEYDDAAIASAASTRAGARVDTHSPALSETLQIARLTSDRPLEMRLIGLAGACFDLGTSMTPSIRARVPELIALVLAQLARWHVAAPTPRGDAPDTWWEGGMTGAGDTADEG